MKSLLGRLFFTAFVLLAGTVHAQDAEYRIKKYPNGNIRYEGWFVNGRPVKEFKRYHENGRLSVVQLFDEDGNSVVKAYYGHGGRLAEGAYKGEKRDGTWKFYGESGRLAKEETYENGRLVGECVAYDAEGNIMDRMYYKNGLLDSVRLQYYPNGNVMARFSYDKGVLDGEYRSYYFDGYPEYVGMYVNNKREGWWFYTDDLGRTDSLLYENGVSSEMEKMIRLESDSSDFELNLFVDPEDYVNNPFDYIPY